MKRMLMLLLAVLLLTGCMADLGRYPWQEPDQSTNYTKASLRLHLPAEADEALRSSMLLLEAKLQELSGGQITLATGYEESMLEAYREGKAGLYLLASSEIEALDERLRFARMPFLVESRDKLFAFLNSSDGPVRRSPVTAQRLDGQIIGTYYRDTMWMLGRTTFYGEIGFFNSVGVLSGLPGNSCFGALGSETILEGTQEELLAALVDGKVKYCELRPHATVNDAVLEKIKGFELTEHRYESWWLVLKNPQEEIAGEVIQLLNESFAYTLEQQNSATLAAGEKHRQQMLKIYGSRQEPSDYTRTWQQSRRFYRENWEQVSIPADIWKELSTIL